MIAILLTFLISYFAVTLAGYLIHWSLHQKWTGQFHKSHMTHHLELYPPDDFTSTTYRHAGKDSTPKFFVILASPFIILPILLTVFGVLPWHLLLIILFMEGLMGFFHDYIHDGFHVNGHWMARVPVFRVIFRKWVVLHYIHHVDMEKNYGIFLFHWDKIFRTFRRKI